MEGEENHGPAAATDLMEAVAASVADIQQVQLRQEERLEQLQQQLQQLQQLQQGVRAPQPGNERPPFLVCRPVARKLFRCVSHALLSNEEALCIQYVKNPTNAHKFAFL
jgi:hypothetical protein